MKKETSAQVDFGENQVVVYQPDETVRLDVRLEEDTVWLTFKAVSPCSKEEDIVRYWLIPSFYGINEQDDPRSTFDIIPNPNNGEMELRFEDMEGKVVVKVYDMMGGLIDVIQTFNASCTKELEYSMKRRAKGIYFFVATGKEGTLTKKVVVR